MGLAKLFLHVSCCLLIGLSWGCQKDPVIKGKVLDNFNQPLKGVSVSIEGMAFTASTDANGDYAIAYVPGKINLSFKLPGYVSNSLELNIATKDQVPAKAITLSKFPPAAICLEGEKDYLPLEPATVREVMDPAGKKLWEVVGKLNFSPDVLTIKAYQPTTSYATYEVPLDSPLPISLPMLRDVFGSVLDTKKVHLFCGNGGNAAMGFGKPDQGFMILVVPVRPRLDRMVIPDTDHPAYVIAYQPDASARAKLAADFIAAAEQSDQRIKRAAEARQQAEEEKRRAQENQRIRVADLKKARNLNDLAWKFATSRNPGVRNGDKAVEYAREAVNLIEEVNGNPTDKAMYYDTLAAAHAEKGMFDQAQKELAKAIELCKGNRECGYRHLPAFQKRLNMFRNNTPWRE